MSGHKTTNEKTMAKGIWLYRSKVRLFKSGDVVKIRRINAYKGAFTKDRRYDYLPEMKALQGTLQRVTIPEHIFYSDSLTYNMPLYFIEGCGDQQYLWYQDWLIAPRSMRQKILWEVLYRMGAKEEC